MLQLIKEIPTEQGYGASISTRIARLYGGISIWLENPIIGDGWRNIKNMVFIDPFTGSYRYTLQGASTMSYYVSLLLKTGIIGFGIMMAIWIKVIKMLKPKKPLNQNNIFRYALFFYLLTYLIYISVNMNGTGDGPFISIGFFLFGIGVRLNSFTRFNFNKVSSNN